MSDYETLMIMIAIITLVVSVTRYRPASNHRRLMSI